MNLSYSQTVETVVEYNSITKGTRTDWGTEGGKGICGCMGSSFYPDISNAVEHASENLITHRRKVQYVITDGI